MIDEQEICSCCKESLERQELPVMTLVLIGKTENRSLDVKACPKCDGDDLIRLAHR